MLCAEAIAAALASGRSGDELDAYPAAFERSRLHVELTGSRNSILTGITAFANRRRLELQSEQRGSKA